MANPLLRPFVYPLTPPIKLNVQPMKAHEDVTQTSSNFLRKTRNFHAHFSEKSQRERTEKMTHFAGETWNGNHIPTSGAVYNTSEVPFPQIWNQEGAATYNDIIGFQDLGKKR